MLYLSYFINLCIINALSCEIFEMIYTVVKLSKIDPVLMNDFWLVHIGRSARARDVTRLMHADIILEHHEPGTENQKH